MNTRRVRATVIAVGGCDFATDPATRLASDLEDGADHLGSEAGATYTVHHTTPSKSGQCTGSYKVQLDQVGAMIIWCKNAVGETLSIDLKRSGGRAVIVDVR